MQQPKLVEVTRSFSYKLNVERYDPSVRFESRDFFCSQKAECKLADAEEVSAKLYKFVKSEVMKAVRECVDEIKGNSPKGLATRTITPEVLPPLEKGARQ